MVHGDGKVIEPLFKGKRNETRVDRRTGEIVPVRCDPDASNHVEGDGEEVYGTKFLIVSARNPEHRVVLDTRYVPFSGEGGEAGVALRSFASIAPQAPGVIGVVWDMALRGVHIDRAMRELGWLTVTRVPAKRNYARRGQRGGRRIERERLIELKNVKRDDGEEVTIRLLAKNGALGIGALQDNGETRFVPLKRIRTQRQKDKVGYRFYNQYAMRRAMRYGRSPSGCTTPPRRRQDALTGPRTCGQSRPGIPTSTGSTPGEATPSPSIGPSRTASTSRRHTASDTSGRRLISLASPNS
jgi:hypothetical protein